MTATALTIWLAFTPAPDYHGVQSWPASYHPIVNYHADANLVPRFVAQSLIREESRFNPEAQSYKWEYREDLGRNVKTDKVLACGIAQVSANRAHESDHVRKAGMRLADYDWRDPGDSLRVGMAYLGRLLVKFRGELRPSVAGYNCGAYRASEWWSGRRALPVETSRYVAKVLGLD